ncbi:MAG: TetR/AcrR family transcriptional regulator [Candidatus Puniceispirillum sp.]|mgnify:FL=1|jgi:AcrR family transcriptional regulator|nr:TetR/AcrR family transcriptional regulator [Candidatus Puniceispirillum sp.]MDA8675960.1 TetR/AcrR family transcriptional regulator [Alphaproteobacteria bacterium]
MSKLRQIQRADRESRILSAALRKFRADGYNRSRIEDIAEVAEVSVGTVYNYYCTKGDILIAAVTLEVEEVLAEGQVLVDHPPEDLSEAILALTYCYYDHSLNYLNKDMWRRVLGVAIEAGDTQNGRRYAELDAKLIVQVGDLVRRFQQNGEIDPDLDAAALGRVLFHNLNQLFITFVTDDAMTLENLRQQATTLTMPLAKLLIGTMK